MTVVLHIGWAAMLMVSDQGLHTTPLHSLHQALGDQRALVILTLLACSVMAAAAELLRPSMRTVALLLPQQMLVLIVAGGAITAVVNEHYADGVERSAMFILPDQWAYILIAVFYTRSMLAKHGVSIWKL